MHTDIHNGLKKYIKQNFQRGVFCFIGNEDNTILLEFIPFNDDIIAEHFGQIFVFVDDVIATQQIERTSETFQKNILMFLSDTAA